MGNNNLIQVLLNNIARGSVDSASVFWAYEPEVPECLKEENREQ